MKITGKKVAGWVGMTLGVIGGVALGGLFLNGTFLSTWGLKILPNLVHQIVGWLFIGGALLLGVLALVSKK
jgi:hypothetical protein